MKHFIQQAHFVGIAGTGMSGIAEILHSMGIQVSGSDSAQNNTVERLKAKGITIFSEQIGSNINFLSHAQNTKKENVVVVVSSAIHKHNPEILAAHQAQIPVIHRSEMLSELMKNKQSIAVAGTHGKTTTTSILSSALTEIGTQPTVVIGGKVNQLKGNSKFGNSDIFLAEVDESDGTFLRFFPHIAVITNIDKDHMDFYHSLDDIIKAFEKFASQIPFYGTLCACYDDPINQSLLANYRRKKITYGLRQDSDITASNIKHFGLMSKFTPIIFGTPCREVELAMPGNYNVSNALASIAVCSALNLDIEKCLIGIENFSGVENRFTVVGKVNNVTVVDDYAHNPQKIGTLLKGTRDSFPNHAILCIFQPHRYTRLKSLMQEFSVSFAHADGVLVSPIYAANEEAIFGVNVQEIAKQIAVNSFQSDLQKVRWCEEKSQVTACFISAFQKLFRPLNKNQETIVLVLGAGDSGFYSKNLITELEKM